LCRRCYTKKWRRENREKAIRSTVAWRARNPEKAVIAAKKSHATARKRYHSDASYRLSYAFKGLLARHGITQKAYEEKIAQQGHRCAICRNASSGTKRLLFCVDHDHDTGKIRGLLCITCNTGIGALKDDPRVLEAAIRYLKEHGKC
jgi:hypothetical protein